MIFRNAFNLFIDNFKLNYKYLLYKIIVVLLTVGLSAALIVPNISFIFSSAELSTLVGLFKDFFDAIAKGDTEFLAGFSERLTAAVADMGTLLQSKTSNIVFTAVSAVVILLVSKFLGGMGNFTLGSLLDDRLSSYANTSFSGAFIKNLGKSSLWQLFYVPVTFVYDVLVILLCYAFFLLMPMPLATMISSKPRRVFTSVTSVFRRTSMPSLATSLRYGRSVHEIARIQAHPQKEKRSVYLARDRRLRRA